MEINIQSVGLELKNSTIKRAGLGVFAKEDIPSGVFIGKYEGSRYPAYFELSEEEATYAYTTEDGNGEHIIPEKSCIFRYINDVVDFNTSLFCNKRVYLLNYYHNVRFVEFNNLVFIETLNNIKAGEELFIRYGSGYWYGQISYFKWHSYQSLYNKDKSFSDDEEFSDEEDFPDNRKILRRNNSAYF